MDVFMPAAPPILYGPIYPITPVMHLSGVQPGYTLIATGYEGGLLANHFYAGPGDRPLSDQYIPFDILPRENDYIVVEQKIQFRAGGPYESGPSPVDQRIRVSPLPNTFPTLGLGTNLHSCSDYIALTSLIPGAWVYVQLESGEMLVNAVQARKGTEDNFALDYRGPLPGGKYVEVWQSASNKSNPDRDSRKMKYFIEDFKFSDPLPEMGFHETPKTCYNEVFIKGALEGSQWRMEAPDNGQWFTRIHGNMDPQKIEGSFPNVIGPGEPDSAETFQWFERCGLKSPMARSPPIIKTEKLPIPKVVTPVCDKRKSMLITNLAPGNALRVERRVNGQPHPERDHEMWVRDLPSSTYSFPVTDRWSLDDPAGPVSFILLQKGGAGCPVDSDKSDPVEVTIGAPPEASPDGPGLNPQEMFYCSNLVWFDKPLIGAGLQIRDQDGRSLLQYPIDITESPTIVRLPQRLDASVKQIYAEQYGCYHDLRSNWVNVGPYHKPNLPDPAIPENAPPRVSDKSVKAEGLVPGAKVYVVVDGSRRQASGALWALEQDVFSEKQTISLIAPLKEGTKIGLIQYLCDDSDSSNRSPAMVPVTKAKVQISLNIFNGRFNLQRGASNNFDVYCRDTITGIENDSRWGAVTVEGIAGTCRCGACPIRNLFIPEGDTRTNLKITIAGTDINEAGGIGATIVDPPPPNFRLSLSGGPLEWSFASSGETLVARVEALDWTVTVEYPATRRGFQLNGLNGGRVNADIQNVKAGSGNIQVSGQVQIVYYKADLSTSVGGKGYLLNARFLRTKQDGGAAECWNWNWGNAGDAVVVEGSKTC